MEMEIEREYASNRNEQFDLFSFLVLSNAAAGIEEVKVALNRLSLVRCCCCLCSCWLDADLDR